MHPEAEQLEAYAEGTLDGGDQAVVESHVVGCVDCQGAVEEWRALFAALEGLPQLAPSAGFPERVMARVQVASRARLWRAQALAQVRAATTGLGRWMPQTTRGWAFATAMLGLPAILGSALVAWLLSRDYVSAQALWIAGRNAVDQGAQRLGESVVQSLLQTDVVAWLVANTGEFLATAGMRGVGTLVAVAGVTTMLSIYVLYRNLFRTPTRESHYVTYSF
jgi:anti-sigma factor RsiW